MDIWVLEFYSLQVKQSCNSFKEKSGIFQLGPYSHNYVHSDYGSCKLYTHHLHSITVCATTYVNACKCFVIMYTPVEKELNYLYIFLSVMNVKTHLSSPGSHF